VVVSVDEWYFSERVCPKYAYSPRCRLTRPSGGWKARTLLLAIASDGTRYHELSDGADRAQFAEFVKRMPWQSGAVVLLDNCSTHKKLDAVYDAKGYHALFLPPYSPQFQPVELAFAKVKHSFQTQWPWPGGIPHAVDAGIATVTASNVAGFFRECMRNISKAMVDAGCSKTGGE
jgi:hypothetical protein